MKHVWKKAIGILLVLALVLQPLPITLRAAEETAGDATVAKVVEAPVFSHKSGNYDDAFELTLSAEEGATIYYSTDGSDPTPKDGAESSSSSVQKFEAGDKISVHDRTGEPNVLATAANSEKFAQDKRF
ncbi:MAG: chitobiase/beta-hexosaminidase C-terminal domain-containing protein [Roseburia sp.]|nr:chitobiase/beta-hexosaminidase C-terminal domain-containing protein [Roseburia sp.]